MNASPKTDLQKRVAGAFLWLALTLLGSGRCHASACGNGSGTAAGTVVDHYLYDPMLKRSWAVMVDCRHPAWPAMLIPAAGRLHDPAHDPIAGSPAPGSPAPGSLISDAPTSGEAPSRPWLRAGAVVRVWRIRTDGRDGTNGVVRIELAGVAIESAPLGATVKVRVGERSAVLRGIVRGTDSVELVDGVAGWRQP